MTRHYLLTHDDRGAAFGQCLCGEWTTTNTSPGEVEAGYARHLADIEASEAAQGFVHVRVTVPRELVDQVTGCSIHLVFAAKQQRVIRMAFPATDSRVFVFEDEHVRLFVFEDQAAAGEFIRAAREILPTGCSIEGGQ